MFDVRLNANIKRTSGINLEGPSLIRRSRKVWDPPKNGPIAPMNAVEEAKTGLPKTFF